MYNTFLFINQNQKNMKRITFLLLAAFLIASSTVNCQKVTSDAVVSIMKVRPTTSVTNEQFEAVYLEEFFPAFYKEFSVPMCLMKKIQGHRMEEYAVIKVFESLERRNQLYPKPGVITDETRAGNKNMKETWSRLYKKASKVASTGYLVLPFSGKSIEVKTGNVVMVWELEHTLEEGMKYEDLEQFYQEEYIPSYINNFPGSQFCVLKGERGERTGKYTEFIVINSMEEFDKWTAENSKKTKQAFQNMGAIQEKMNGIITYSNGNVYIVL